jgi:hypothetical protein
MPPFIIKLLPTIETLKTLGVFSAVAAILGWSFKIWRNRLTLHEKQILVAAPTGTHIWRMNMPGCGILAVRAGKYDLGDDATPDVEFVDALDRLISRGLVRWTSGDVYQLTGAGLKLSKLYAGSIPLDQIPSEQNSKSPRLTPAR